MKSEINANIIRIVIHYTDEGIIKWIEENCHTLRQYDSRVDGVYGGYTTTFEVTPAEYAIILLKWAGSKGVSISVFHL